MVFLCLREGGYERLKIYGCYTATGAQQLCGGYVCGAVVRVCDGGGFQAALARSDLGWGRDVTVDAADYRLAAVSTGADRAVDLEILLVNGFQSAGAGRHAGLDVRGGICLCKSLVW